MNTEERIDREIERYERMLDSCENGCEDMAIISAILKELKELKEDM